MTVLYVAVDEWLDSPDGDRTLFEFILAALGSLQAALASSPPELTQNSPQHPSERPP